ncbi:MULTISPECIES: tRNA-dihydrouridine synthase family protein [unclassified Halomonas]|uniref:tRNA dihydrouridine synthase n=1 Tax=unclassified Halomonas TaxID=2609666 RepID=UPI001EF3F0FD|nr:MULTISPECIES: tRNA-dihydrouridine synthase family protein [unclassified Halomonas]MCG7575674.1 tRNA-dihydrouridine synthase family protein [Halomonas sp. MMH1-48]MCG7602736.1 tRNA-dihydrouridine synthase family protein [Halomonas sp. MM17-34]MCG7612225.1 tRNA-dihydrouridine synthase family protein [Halomonas sp. MM17-29]MCG7619106.1 tRNA-dihydrouridine synthase family protein [Halomonas sp. DSH1-27]
MVVNLLHKGKIGLAPMEGVIDALTRDLLTRQAGFDWSVTEFVRVVDTRLPPRVFYKHCPELQQRPVATPSGVPVHLQLLGADPQALAENARQALALGAISIDLNFGCPAKLVNRHDGGASLLRQPERVYHAVKAVAEALDGEIPVTAKIRLGFANRRLAVACAQATESGGAARLVVHGRTRDEGYRPPAHWEWIGKVRRHVSIPVVANGDIWTLEDYWKARTLSGCCDVMLGRSALADPWLAPRIRHWQQTGERLADTTWTMRASVLQEYAALQRQHLPDRVVVSLVKQWLAQMRQGNAEANQHFQRLKRLTDLDTLLGSLTPSTSVLNACEPA